jgi:MFS family permease
LTVHVEGFRMPQIWNDRSILWSPGFVLLGALQVVLIASITLIVVPLPAIQLELGLERPDLALLASAYGLSFSGLLLLGGRVADLYGHRRVFLAGVAVFGAGSVLAALAPGSAVLVSARFAQGAGAALAAPAAVALVRAVVPDPARLPAALAVWGTLSVSGAVSGSLLSGVIAAVASWRWAFAIPVMVAATVLLAAPRVLGMPAVDALEPVRAAPERAPDARRLDVVGGVLVTAGMVALSYGLLHAAAAVAVAGGLLLAAFVAVEARASAPLLPPAFLASPGRAAALLAVLVTAAASATHTFFLTLWFQQVRGMSPMLTSAAFAPGLLVLATGPLAGRLAGRYGVRAVTVWGLLLSAAAMGLLGLIEVDTPYAGVVLAGLILFPVGSGLALSGATVAALDGVPRGQSGLAGGLLNTAMEAGPTVGLAVLAALAAAYTGARSDPVAITGGYGFALTVAALLIVLTAALTSVAGRKRSHEKEVRT